MSEAGQSSETRRGIRASSVLLLVPRLIAGAVLAAAAYFKIADYWSFTDAIKAFKLIEADHLILMGTYVLPWTELFVGLALILGIWTRAAAFLYCALMAMFIVAIIDALGRGLGGIPCGCFGSFKLYCEGGLGWCKVYENGVLTAVGLLVLGFGGGRLSVDALIDRRLKAI